MLADPTTPHTGHRAHPRGGASPRGGAARRRRRALHAVLACTAVLAASFPLEADRARTAAAAEAIPRADVVIVGAGTSGIAAALSARREGAGRVVLLEETDYIGGQVAAGVGTMDEGGRDAPDQRKEGIWGEVLARMLAEYARLGWPHASTCYGAASPTGNICVSPSVARRVYTRMLQEAGVELRLGVTARPIVVRDHVRGVRWSSRTGAERGTYSTGVLIDATEYGDVIAAAGAAYRSGKGLGNTAGDAPEGHVQDITYTAVVRQYAAGTMPAELNMLGQPFPVALDDPAPDATRTRVLGWFASQVALEGSNVAGAARPWGSQRHARYRGLPDPSSTPYLGIEAARITRTVVNFANDWPNETVGDLPTTGMPVRYLEDPRTRRDYNCRAKLRTIQFVWYMQNGLGLPDWSVADDEGFDTPVSRATRCSGTVLDGRYAAIEAAMPLVPYVRESRRGLGSTTLTGVQIRRVATGEATVGQYGRTAPGAQARQAADTIAIAYYPIDLHGANRDPDLETELETDALLAPPILGERQYGPFGIPMRALISRDVAGLLFAEKNISQSRYTNGATRLQGETSLVGAAAGTLAAVAVRTGTEPGQVPVERVQYRLARAGQLPATNRFLDIPRAHAATVALELAAVANLDPAERHTVADPAGSVTRAQAATWIRRALGLRRVTGMSRFADVPVSASYAPDVEALRRAGVRLSCTSGSFCPEAPIRRGDHLVWLGQAMDARWGTRFTTAAEPVAGRFTDIDPGSRSRTIHALAAHLRVAHGVTFGTLLRPRDRVTRRDVALWTAWERFDPRYEH